MASLYGDMDLKKMGKQNKKSIKKNTGNIFIMTLGITLLAGVLTLAVIRLTGFEDMIKTGEEVPVIAGIENKDIEDITEKEDIIAEPIENGRQDAAAGKKETKGMEAGENKADVETDTPDDGLDEDGCLRNENGRILVKRQKTEGDEATLLFGGDILFDDSYAMMATMRQRGGEIRNCFSAETLEEMDSADIFMLNNEFTYTDRGEPTAEKQFTFRAKPENAALLSEIGVDIVSLANNHAYDYGEVSLLDSLTTLEGIGMPYVGAGRNLSEASEAVYFLAGNQKIAVLSATQIERLNAPDTKGATESSPGVFRCFTEEEIFDKIKEAKENSDFVIVYIHWGTEKEEEPDWSQPDMAKKLVAAGTDLIIGDHPHVLQEIASVDGVPVIYSVGNYWFNSSTLNTCLVKVVLKDGKMQSFQFLPALQSGCYTKLLQGAEKEAALNHMRSISDTVTIDAEGYVEF